MRKKLLVIGFIYIAFLVAGVLFNTRQGMYLFSEFWPLQKDGSYTHLTDSIRRLDHDGQIAFDMLLAGQHMMAELTEEEDGWRVTTSEGWEVVVTGEQSMFVETGGYVWFENYEIVLTDMEAMGLRFERAMEEERTPFFDEEGHEIGESILLVSETGETISFREEWYDRPEWNVGEQERILMTDGMTLDMEGHDQRLYMNEQGEFLVNPDRLFYIAMDGKSISKNGLAHALVNMADAEPETRGDWQLALVYTAIYALGAALFLWPEKLAFFGERWRYQTEPELSDAGILMEKLGGVLLMGMGVIMMFYPLFAR